MANYSLPSITGGGLSRYLQEIRKFPLLKPDEEYMLAKAWREHEDIHAAHRLVTSHLRLAAKTAMGYRGYGLPVGDLVQEGNRGLMEAVRRFDPEKGFRLATYALWWIRAAIQEHILHSWSLVKIGTTAAQKKLFFNLRKLKGELHILEEGDLSPEQVQAIAERLNVAEREVVSMNQRLAGHDRSLHAPVSQEGDVEWQDWLEDESVDQEQAFAESEELSYRRALLGRALAQLSEREREIFTKRRLSESPPTLEKLSQKFGVSRERIRQLEVQAFNKVQTAIREAAAAAEAVPVTTPKALPPARPD